MEVTRRRGRRRKKLLDDLKDRRGYSVLKEEALDRTMWRNRFGGDFEPVIRQNTEWMKPCFLINFPSWPNVLRQAWINLFLRTAVSAFVAFLYILCGVLFTNTLYAIYPWGDVASNRDRTLGGSVVEKSLRASSYKMIHLNSTCLWHAKCHFLHTLHMLLYCRTTVVIRAS